MDLLLQCWGGVFYLANKICFALAETKPGGPQRQYRIAGWMVYLLGVPAWVTILVLKHDWIAASIEAGGVPAMLLGLTAAYHAGQEPNRFLDRLASAATYTFIVIGVGYSLFDYGGLTSLSQCLEIGVTIGFLLGSYLLAKGRASGWLLFMLMNACMGSLMMMQNKPILALQQAASLCFVIFGCVSAARMKAAPGPVQPSAGN